MEYKEDDGNWQTGNQFKVNTEGSHIIYYRAVDLAGNVETAKELAFKLDTAKPVVSLNLAGHYRPEDTLTVDFSYNDTGSGVQSVEARLDNVVVGKGQQITLNNYTPGNHFLRVTVTDYAGNQTVKEQVFTVGNRPPANNIISSTEHLIADIKAWVQGGKIPQKLAENNLIKELEIVQYHLDEGDWEAARGKLGALINYLKAQSGKKIPADLTAHLVKDAGALKKLIEQWKQDETTIRDTWKEAAKREAAKKEAAKKEEVRIIYMKKYHDDDEDEDEDDDEDDDRKHVKYKHDKDDDDDEDEDDYRHKGGYGHQKKKGWGHYKHDDD